MFGQPQSNFGFQTTSFPQQGQYTQMDLQSSSLLNQGQSNNQNQSNNFNMSNTMQTQAMNNYFGQNMQQDNNSMMQNQFSTDKTSSGMQNSFMQPQATQFNVSMPQDNNQMNNMQNSVIQQSAQSGQVSQGNQRASDAAYTTYQDLPNYGDNVDLNQVVEMMKMLFEDKNNWRSRFDAIDNLRILNKYYSQKMNEIIGVFWTYILESFDSQKTIIVKNILMFSTEAFMNAREVRILDEVINLLVPQVIIKSISEKSVIKKEAETALCYLFSNCCSYDSAVVTLCTCCLDKNPTVSEVALVTLGQTITAIEDRLVMYKFETLQLLMMTLAKLIDSAKKGNMKKWATNLCVGIFNRFGRENYQELVMSTVAPQNQNLAQHLAKAIEDKKDIRNRESGLHDFIQKKKRETMNGKAGGFGTNGYSGMGGSFLDIKVLGENYQYENYQPNMQNMQGMHNMQSIQGLHNMQGMQSMQNNIQNNMQNMQPSMGGLFNGQMGLGFPQNY